MIDPTLLARLDRVATKLAAAASLPGEPVMFGASAHRFELGPPLTDDEVTAFEREHGVSLPEDYRAFITRIGNRRPGRWGGAGPYYGLHPLRDWATSLREMPGPKTLATPFPAEPGRVFRIGRPTLRRAMTTSHIAELWRSAIRAVATCPSSSSADQPVAASPTIATLRPGRTSPATRTSSAGISAGSMPCWPVRLISGDHPGPVTGQ